MSVYGNEGFQGFRLGRRGEPRSENRSDGHFRGVTSTEEALHIDPCHAVTDGYATGEDCFHAVADAYSKAECKHSERLNACSFRGLRLHPVSDRFEVLLRVRLELLLRFALLLDHRFAS